jgi:hypothetical protein
MKKEKNIIETKWLELKAKSKVKDINIDEIDRLTCSLIVDLSKLTENNITEIDGVAVDLYKDRVFWIVEKVGLLPEYKDPGEDFDFGDDDEIEDDYYRVEEEFEIEIDDSKFYR